MEEVQKGIKSTKEVGEVAGDSWEDMKALKRKDLSLGARAEEKNSTEKMWRNRKEYWRKLKSTDGVWEYYEFWERCEQSP